MRWPGASVTGCGFPQDRSPDAAPFHRSRRRQPVRAHPAGWDEDGVAELGYRLRQSAWGNGYATEGSLALIDHGFTESRVRRVVAETLAGNLGSRRVLEKS